MISVEDFRHLDLRVGEIVAAEQVAGKRRLLKVRVDLGSEQRTLVGGLAEHYTPEQLVGLQVVVVANLEPASIAGIRSEGMMLGVGCNGGQGIAMLTVNRPVANGSPVQ